MSYKLLNNKQEPRKINGLFILGLDNYGQSKAVDLAARTLTLTGTDETKDRDGDIITNGGWDFGNFHKNPVFLWAHIYESVPLARIEKIFNRTKMKRHDFLIKFPTRGLNPFADMILDLYNERMINASSVGFIPYEWEEIKDDENGETQGNSGLASWCCIPKRFLTKELLELSGCAVPCNPNAVAEYLGNKTFGGMKSVDLVKAFMNGSLELKHKDDILEELRVRDFVVEDDKIIISGVDLGVVTVDGSPDHVIKRTDYNNFLVTDAEESKEEKETENELPVIDKEEILKPYPDEHACRLENPDDFDSFRRKKCAVKHDGKCIDYIYGIKDRKSKLQAMRYEKDVWTAADARKHCKDNEGVFEAAGKKETEDEFPTAEDELKVAQNWEKIHAKGQEDKILAEALIEENAELLEKNLELRKDNLALINKSGAVLSKKNLKLLNTAVENINLVIESAKREEENPVLEPDKTMRGTEKPENSQEKAERKPAYSQASLFDAILKQPEREANQGDTKSALDGKATVELCDNLRELQKTLEQL